MGGYVTFDIFSHTGRVFLYVGGHLFQGTVIELVFELGGKISGLRRLVLSHPGETVVVGPLLFKGIAVTCPSPEFRFLQMNGLHARINGPLHMAFYIVQKGSRGDYVGNIPSMPDGFAVAFHLPFLKMRSSVESAPEIILILPPGDPGHKMDGIAFFSVLVYPLLKGHVGIIDPVHNGNIGTDVVLRLPGGGDLKGGFFLSPGRIACKQRNAKQFAGSKSVV